MADQELDLFYRTFVSHHRRVRTANQASEILAPIKTTAEDYFMTAHRPIAQDLSTDHCVRGYMYSAALIFADYFHDLSDARLPPHEKKQLLTQRKYTPFLLTFFCSFALPAPRVVLPEGEAAVGAGLRQPAQDELHWREPLRLPSGRLEACSQDQTRHLLTIPVRSPA